MPSLLLRADHALDRMRVAARNVAAHQGCQERERQNKDDGNGHRLITLRTFFIILHNFVPTLGMKNPIGYEHIFRPTDATGVVLHPIARHVLATAFAFGNKKLNITVHGARAFSD